MKSYPLSCAHRLPLLVIFLTLIAAGAFAESLPGSGYAPVVPGLEYLHIRDTNHPWSIHIARLDRSRPDFEIVSTHAKGQIAGLSTVVAQVESLPGQMGKPVAAVNGDFFVIAKGPYQGDPLGLQILTGELISAPNGASFWTEPGGKYCLEKVASRFQVVWPHGGKFFFGLNQERKSNEMALFTPAFGPSTRTTNGLELVLEKVNGKPWLPLQADRAYAARVREVRTVADTPLTPGRMVLSVGPELAPHYSGIRAGALLQLSTDTSPDVSRAANAVGGRPILVEHGRVQSWPATKGGKTAPEVRAPRTAIGWNQNYLYLVVVDGRQKELSMGMTFSELARFMKKLGCAEAMNLDGGGSTTFWLDGKVMNSPSDKHERTVANALVIMAREKISATGAKGH